MPGPGTLLLFLSGDPDLAERRRNRGEPIGMAARIFLPANLWLGRPPPSAPGGETGDDALFSDDQLACAQIVLDAIRGTRWQLRFVDVNRAGDAQPLVQRYVSDDDVLPILVRTDGARLAGNESFSKSSVRSFVGAT